MRFQIVSSLILFSSLIAFSAHAAEPIAENDGKDFSLLVQPIGYGPSDTLTAGFIGAYRVVDQTWILVESMQNLFFTSYGDVSYGNRPSYQGNSYGVHLKQFFWNSLYMKAGVDQRHVSFSYSTNGDANKLGFESDSTAVSIALGNEWHLAHFTLGCDWIGMVAPIRSSFSNEVAIGSVSPDQQSRVDAQKENTTRRLTQALRLYLGVSF